MHTAGVKTKIFTEETNFVPGEGAKSHALSRSLFLILALLTVGFSANAQVPGDYHTFGILGGFSFPKMFFAKIEINFSETFGVDYEPSASNLWTIQQVDLDYYFYRSDWSPFIALGVQSWNFYGFDAAAGTNGILPNGTSQATALSVPIGLQYVGESGLALELAVGASIFVNGSSNLQGKIIPEGQAAIGYFF